MPTDTESVLAFLTRLTASWRTGQWAELAVCFHPDAVLSQPGRPQVVGAAACAKSYEDFMRVATVTEYTESEHRVNVWGDTAVATYRFEMAWEMHGQPHREPGYDLLVLQRQAGSWVVVWRTLLPVPAENG